jgi:hypothetical protein
LAASTLLISFGAPAQNDSAAILQRLLALYPTAKATADGTDLVTAGAVLVLQKDNLFMNKVDLIPTPNVYKNGSISQSGLFGALGKFGAHLPGVNGGAPNPNREFVTGEKFFATKFIVRPDAVDVLLMSDPIQDQRYHAILRFPYAKGTTPSPDDVAGMIAEVMKTDSSGDSQDQSAANQGGQSGAAAAPVATKTIAIGQTRDQVIAAFGVPSKIVQLGAKEIDFFPDMKVTFVQNKVVDVK